LTKSGPLKTDQDFFIVDAPFKALVTASDVAAGRGGKGDGTDGVWQVERLAERIKAITGVLEVGIFCGMDGYEARDAGSKKGGQKPVAVYFGMEDGSVKVRTKTGES
jgi:ribose 5-phosphate isomerase A